MGLFSKSIKASELKEQADTLMRMYMESSDPKTVEEYCCPKARSLYEQALAKGYQGVLPNLAYLYLAGLGGPVNYDDGFRLASAAAAEGDLMSMNNVAVCYESGHGVEKNLQMAVLWLRKAAEKGYSSSYWPYAFYLYKGLGIDKDTVKAREYAKKALAKGLVSQKKYDDLFNAVDPSVSADEAFSRGYEAWGKDDEEAVKWYRYAAEKGEASSMCNLALAYDLGRGVPKDAAKAVEYYKKSFKAGCIQAAHNLSYFYYYGIAVEKDFEMARYLLTTAIEAGNKGSEDRFAMFFPEEAELQLAEKRYKAGEAKGKDYYLVGKARMKEDKNLATDIFLDGIEKFKDPDCCAGLAAYFYDVEENVIQAYNFFLASMDNGGPECLENRMRAMNFFDSISSANLSETECELLRQAAFALAYKDALEGVPEAEYSASIKLPHGVGCKDNVEEAMQFLKSAADHGYPKAVELWDKINKED